MSPRHKLRPGVALPATGRIAPISRWRKLSLGAALLAAGGLAASAWSVLQSQWLRDRTRAFLVQAAERATGGRVEIGALHFDWQRLRADLENCTLHGTEPPGKPPLFQAERIAVGLKIVSLWRRDIDLRSIEVTRPRVFLLVAADGRTNLPWPKTAGKGAAETVLDLAIGRFQVSDGAVRVEAPGGAEGLSRFEARGGHLAAQVRYDAHGPRYQGTVGIHPLEVNGVPLEVDLAGALERGRITLASGRISTGNSSVDLAGGVLELGRPAASVRYDARIALPDAARLAHAPGLEGGEARASGEVRWSGGAEPLAGRHIASQPQPANGGPVGDPLAGGPACCKTLATRSGRVTGEFQATGELRASDVSYREGMLALRRAALAGSFTADRAGIEIREARVSGAWRMGRGEEMAQGRVTAIAVRGQEVALRGVALETLGGTFRGDAQLEDGERYQAAGEIAGFTGRRLVALYSAEPLPWDAVAAGTVRVEGSLRRRADFRAEARIALAPAAGSAPVSGRIAAAYDGRTGVLDLGRSMVALPSSRAEFSGSPGNIEVRFQTTDFNDLLPLLGENATALPVRLEGGSARFEGAVTGTLAQPRFAGHAAAARFRFAGRLFDSFQADVEASGENVRLANAVLSQGKLRAAFDAAAGLNGWHAGDASPIFGHAKISGAPVGDLLALAGWNGISAAGSLTAAGSFSGTLAQPQAGADVTVVQGSYDGEPFDRFSGRVAYTADTLTLQSGTVTAGAKQAALAGSFRHAPGRFGVGSVEWQANTNSMPLDQIQTLERARPGVKGSVEVRASGRIDLTPAPRVARLDAEVAAHGLQLGGRELGDARLVAASQGTTLRARLEATLAGAAVQGEGTVGLEGDYPAQATVTFSQVDLARLQPWIAEHPAIPVAGFAQGALRIAGPALRPQAIAGELRLERVEIRPQDTSGAAANLVLRNAGPVLATIAGGRLRIGTARLTGRITDITVAGGMSLSAPHALDLRVNGKVDAAALHELDPGFTASGTVNADAAIRGTAAAPEVSGRVQFEKLSCNAAGFPNGISNAAGTILFSGNRATIQTLSGETGGGKVQLTGFAGYDGSRLIFQLQAQAREVRIRYPEGVSTVADASLRLTGTSSRSTLGGTITIRRSGFNPRSDFSSLIARSAEPLETPSAQTGVLAGMNFDVQIETAPDVRVESSLTDDLQVDANLRLRGTLSNPALVGRVNITQGQVLFYGTKYTVRQGSVSFYNALKIEPVFDIDLETKARGVDITLAISGPLHHLNLTPRSDPPMQFGEIVALLATGITPTSDPALLSQQAAIPQGWQQAGASELLGQAIANPVAGRLQRFFGVTRLRIDPTLPGVEINNPQARVTLEQQVTPDITFTYIVNVTNSNPQVVRLEWSLSRQWSVVALRDESGVFGLDFFFKKRF